MLARCAAPPPGSRGCAGAASPPPRAEPGHWAGHPPGPGAPRAPRGPGRSPRWPYVSSRPARGTLRLLPAREQIRRVTRPPGQREKDTRCHPPRPRLSKRDGGLWSKHHHSTGKLPGGKTAGGWARTTPSATTSLSFRKWSVGHPGFLPASARPPSLQTGLQKDDDIEEGDLPEHKRPPAPVDFSKIDPGKPESILKMTKKGKTLMMFVTVSGSPTEKETEEVTSLWQGSLFNANYDVQRFIVGSDRAIFMLRDGSYAWEIKDFLEARVCEPRVSAGRAEQKIVSLANPE
ncbi:LRP chaperone MESD isoform X2 [Lemur catta]|uniref:LRP chaperone MESD isoform X2 n=1 Tax=Lemur catta TaxID=9447 RepID=UPI001E26DCC4|nr:LRP chaperone MESD isoform X2 [Lemur catta]